MSNSDMYWDLYNKIGGDNEHVAMSTFKMGLPFHSEQRDSLTMQPYENMYQLMKRIEEHEKLEDNRLQYKGKAPAMFQYQKKPKTRGFQQKPRREIGGQNPISRTEGVNINFKEPVHKILEKIKHEPYFRWPGKMSGDPTRRNQNLYCSYYRDKGHTTEQCRTFKDYLELLVKVGHLSEYVVSQEGSTIG